MLDMLFAWPEQFEDRLKDLSEPNRSCLLYRSRKFAECESHLISHLAINPDSDDHKFLYVLLLLSTNQTDKAEKLISSLSGDLFDSPKYSFLFAQHALLCADIPRIFSHQNSLWVHSEDFWPLYLAKAAFHIHLNQLAIAKETLLKIPNMFQDCLEANRLISRILEREGKYNKSLEIISTCAARFPYHLPLRIHQLDTAIKARSQDKTLPILNSIINDFGTIPEVLTLASQVRLLQNRPSDARYLILKNRVWNSISPNQESISSNIYNCYDRLGLVDWLLCSPYLSIESFNSLPLAVRENFCMQLASMNYPSTESYIANVLSDYRSQNDADSISSFSTSTSSSSSSFPKKQLRVGWICGDISYHPVGRFLFGLLNSLISPTHSHTVLDVQHHGNESKYFWFKELESIDYVQVDTTSFSDKLQSCRNAELDIAIDLSGWTSGHFMRGFYSQIAPIQISYLGYFGSTGLPSMNYWLGDRELFPTPMTEWHSESLLRLKRCFIAWNPPSSLPEATLDVPYISFYRKSPVRFGCFNNHRKYSEHTLFTWGRILDSIPDSKLVLKRIPQA